MMKDANPKGYGCGSTTLRQIIGLNVTKINALVVELVDTLRLGRSAERCRGSSPL